MLCQWPTLIRKGSFSPRAKQFLSYSSERVGVGPLGAKVHPLPPWRILNPPVGNIAGKETLTVHEPRLSPATAMRPLSKGSSEATTRMEMIRICQGLCGEDDTEDLGHLLPVLISSLQIEGSV